MWVEPHGKKFRIRDERGGRKVTIAGGYRTKAAANDGMKLLAADVLRGDALLPRGGTITLDDWIDEWWPHYERSLKDTSAHSEGARVRNHIRPLLGGYVLDDLDSVVILQWLSDLSDGLGPWPSTHGARRRLAPKTVHNVHGVLHTILDAAVAARRIRINPCVSTGKSLPKREPKEMRFLSDPEIGRLISAMPEHWRPLVLLLVATGLRWGEAIGLKVRRVDLLAARPQLRVEEQLQERPGSGSDLYFSSPKSARSRRTVSFPTTVALRLAPLLVGKDGDEVVFTTVLGNMIRTRNFRRIWLATCARAGLDGLRVHDLRHTHAAMLIAANRPLSAISRRLGHSSIAVTDALYGHLREEVDQGILDAVAEALREIAADELDAEVAEELTDL
jgi:integrase